MDLCSTSVIFTLLVLMTVLGQAREPTCKTVNRTRKSRPYICCQGENYSLGSYGILPESCNKEPKDENMSLEDAIWSAYDCYIKGTLNGSELTRKSYFSFMSELPESRQAQLWNVLPPENSANSSNNNSDNSINKIKSYWDDYYGALQKVCTKVSDNGKPSAGNDTGIKQKKPHNQYLEPSKKCKNGNIPEYLLFFGLFGSTAEIENCIQEFQTELGLTATRHIYNIRQFCASVNFKEMKLDDLKKPNFGFDDLMHIFYPRFWSKATQKLATQWLVKVFNKKLQIKAETFGEIINALRVQTRKQILQTLEDGPRNVLVNAIIGLELRNVEYFHVRDLMCDGGSPSESSGKKA